LRFSGRESGSLLSRGAPRPLVLPTFQAHPSSTVLLLGFGGFALVFTILAFVLPRGLSELRASGGPARGAQLAQLAQLGQLGQTGQLGQLGQLGNSGNSGGRLGARFASRSVMVRRILVVCGTVAGGGLLGAACVASSPADPANPADPASPDSAEVAEARALIMGERIGEAQEAGTTRGEACRAACQVSYAAACLRVTVLCTGATVITIGGASVPCATAIAAVCLSSAALASVCVGQCPL
jgi:hypothetical protein